MMSASRPHLAWFPLLGLILWLVVSAGCRPAVKASADAAALPRLDQDPMEDGVDADRWPCWRGRNSAGIASDGSPAIRFSATEGFRWKVPVPGEGNSSPVVWGDLVLLTSALDDTAPQTLAILAFDRSDGRLAWQARVGTARDRTHAKNGYASATVATDGERIFAFFGSTGLFCYSFSGEPLWRAPLGNLDEMYGTAASPVLYGDSVIQLCDSDNDSYLAAFDKRSGKQLWRTPRASHGCWTTPILVEADAQATRRTELVVNGTAGSGGLVIAYDPDDGQELWRVRGTMELVVPTALTGNGLVYSISGRNGPIMAIRPGGSGDVTDTRVVWKADRGGPYIPSGVLYRGRLYVARDLHEVACYNPGDGTTVWAERLRGNFTASLVAADGRVYAANERGTVYVFRAGDTFELLAENDLDERCLATPAIASGELFIRTRNHLYCIPESEGAGTTSPGE
jgi:outer membrane protein assembly factor BamB